MNDLLHQILDGFIGIPNLVNIIGIYPCFIDDDMNEERGSNVAFNAFSPATQATGCTEASYEEVDISSGSYYVNDDRAREENSAEMNTNIAYLATKRIETETNVAYAAVNRLQDY